MFTGWIQKNRKCRGAKNRIRREASLSPKLLSLTLEVGRNVEKKTGQKNNR
jgi:hypothetical protein